MMKEINMVKIVKNLFVLLFLVILSSNLVALEKKEPMEVKYGMFITNIYDIDFAKNQYDIQYWYWFHHNDPEFHPNITSELMNAKTISKQNIGEEVVNGIRWDTAKVKAKINQEWDVSKYPFDTQVLEIVLEDSNLDSDALKFMPDTKASKIDPNALPDGWKLLDFKIVEKTNSYHTAFGDPSEKSDIKQSYSRVVAQIHLQREGWRLFSTTFVGFFVATILLLVLFVITSMQKAVTVIPQQPRITLIVGALFSAVGSVYGLSAKLPYTTTFTLADSLQITTFLGVAFAVIGSISSDVLAKNDQIEKATFINRVMFGIFLVLSFGLNGYLIIQAL
jgi:uncharacterized integral membrane protein